MGRQRRKLSAGVPVVCLLVSFVGGCGHKNRASETVAAGQAATQSGGAVTGMRKTWGLQVMNQPGSVFHIEYSPRTSIVDMATVGRTLRGVSEDHSIFLFEDSPELRSKLVPGNFVLFQGLDLRKVDAIAVDPETKNLIVGTETARLNEALKSANIQFKAPVDYADLFSQLGSHSNLLQKAGRSRLALLGSPSYWGNLLEPTAFADFSNSEVEGTAQFSDTDFATWVVHYHYTLNPDHSLNLDVHLERDANGLNVDLNVKGKISRFIQETSFGVTPEGNIRQYFRNGGLHGDVNLDWTIKSSEKKTPMNEVRVKLPGKISIPLTEFTGLPMSLQISVAMLFHPAFTTKDEVAKGSFHVTFSGDEGLNVDGSDVRTDGQGNGDGAIDQSFAFSPLASFGLVMAVAAPRVELRMGTEEIWQMAQIPIPLRLVNSLSNVLASNTIVGKWLNNKVGNPLAIEGAAYFQVVLSTTAAHSGMQSLVPCQQFTMVAKGQIGVDAKWLGNNTDWPPQDIFTKNIVQRQPDVKICGGGEAATAP
jgi:hypothetical protein